jgi:hypothetical protein
MYRYEVPKQHHSHYILATLIAGLALIGLGVYVEKGQLSISLGSFVLEYWIISLFLMVLGASALVVCLTSSLLLKEIKERLNDMLEEKLDRSQKVQVSFLRHSFSVTGQALAYKLEDILAPRYRLLITDDGQRSINPNPQTFEKLALHIQSYVRDFISSSEGSKEKLILVNGITLKDLVDPGNPLSNSITKAVKELSYEARKRSIGERRLVIRAMMLSPRCEAVNLRKTYKQANPQPQASAVDEEVENFFQNYPLQNQTRPITETVEERLQGDIEYSIRAFKNLAHIIETKHSAVKLELKQTVVLPPAYFIITDDYIFIEQYHLGRERLNGYYKCLVGTVPMFQFAAGSAVYNNMRKHFEFLWEVESNKELNQLFRVERLI